MCEGMCSACGAAGAIVVELRRRYAHRRQRREVVAVDQVVRDAWMVRLLFPFLIQNRGSFELLGVVLVVEVDRPIEGERVKDPRFGILRMVLMQPLHCLLVKSGTGVRRDKAAFSSGCEPHPATAPAGSNRSR